MVMTITGHKGVHLDPPALSLEEANKRAGAGTPAYQQWEREITNKITADIESKSLFAKMVA